MNRDLLISMLQYAIDCLRVEGSEMSQDSAVTLEYGLHHDTSCVIGTLERFEPLRTLGVKVDFKLALPLDKEPRLRIEQGAA